PAEPSITIALSQTNYTFPNSDTTYNPTLSFTTTALTPSNTYVVTIIGNTNPPTPVNPVVVPVTNTFTVTMATGGTFNPLKVWSPAGVNGDWSTAANWAPNGAPGSSNDVQFCDLGIVPSVGTPDNTVDSAFNIGSLTYGQTNDYHTTLIDPGLTLTVSGTNGLNVGTGTAAGDALQLTTTVQGPGAALVVSNSSAIINIDQSQPLTSGNSSTTATLDLSGLDTFNASVARVLIGEDTTTALRGACGVLNLAKTNKITMTPGSASPQIDLGANIQSGATPGLASILSLGQTNAIFADSIAVGRGKTVSPGGPIIQFNSSFTNPVAYFRGTNGASSRIGMWSIADAWGAKTSQNSASADFSLGTVNALVDQMWIGVGASQTHLNGANVPGNGTLTLGAGIIDVNTLEVGYSTADAPGNGTVNVNGGTLNVNTFLELAHGAGSSGALNISSATVNANAGVTAGGGGAAITLSTGALSVANAGATLGTPVSPLGSLSAANSTLTLAVQAGTPSASVGTLTGGGAANPVNISSVPVLSQLPAQFPVIQYTTDGGSLATFTLGSLPAASPAYAGYLSNNTANSSLDLVITSGPVVAPLVWGGQINGNWDTSTANWKTNGVSATFRQGYAVVRFDDTLVGNNSVNLTTALTNGSLTVNNSGTDYTFGGPGKLSGGTALTKTGSRMLTLAESGGDDFTGGVEVSGGTLQVGNGGTSGTLPAGEVTVDSGAALVFNRSDNLAVPGVVSGLGTLTQNGTGLLALNGSNSAFGGTITVAHGVLQPGNVAALGTPSVPVTVNNGATLDVNGQKFNNTQPITAAGPGVGGNGAIVNNSTNSPNQILRNVTLSGPTTFGGYSDWDIHASANPAQDATLSTSGTAYNLTKVGTNTVTIFGAVVDGALGDIALQAGSLSFERKTTGLGNPANIVTVFTNATLQFANPSNVWSKVVVLNAGATFRAINQAEFAGPVTLQSGVGSIVANTAGAQFILDAAVGGAGGLTKSGAGILTLTSPSTYAGPTLVSAGTLALVNSGSIDSSVNITVSAGAAIDLSALASPTLTLTAGRGLQGSGTVIGSVTMASGSTLTVGGPGTNTLGTLTVTNSLALQAGSTNLMQVSKAGGSPTSDLVVATNITYGGTLTVSGAGGALAAGDTFKLFSAGSLGGSFSRINLPFGTTWDTSRLGIDGTIKVLSVVRPQFSSVGPTNGGFQLSLSGPGGDSYHVWSTTNVAAAPVTSTWTALVTNGLFDNVTGAATFLDTSATNYPRLFYTITVP
ncbi:MAG TPA: autotransporter-associated beta strand repeat-containing protein, partial [Candidatus Acidoferrum sp.]|nr:autotransporter-associated beta strand repeat-containing protein [Candidatus Acidoferrum sp.]